ncbi:MAG: Gfo/Idh/MocA family oxidoreductase [Chitinispirillales bacterium]|jgi:glycerol-3-phosphate cytidylyltransferase|nr:Gfo/Idh/MocA family oxidoreductase [Chitinispirillales bacterium]
MKRVITYGTFDLFHKGHYNLLKRAKALGDYLIVGVTTEQYDEYRGKVNVIDSLMERIEHVRHTGFADEIIVEDHIGQKIEDIQKYGIDIFTVGSDWQGAFDYLKGLCDVVYLKRTRDISSTMLRARNQKIIRIGIIGSGRIANRFVPEAKRVSSVNIEAVYNPNIESARTFGETYELDTYTDDWNVFLDKIDAVYIASPHGTHYGYIKSSLDAGKHVLCEKPMVLQKVQAQELFSLAKQKELVLMEAIKTAYSPGFIKLLSIAKIGSIGQIYDVEACFTKLAPENTRELKDVKYGGSFTELASYPLLAVVKILGSDYEEVKFESFNNKKDLDIYAKAYIKYKNCLATVKVGLGVKSEGQLIISGSKGYIIADAPWWKTQSFETRYEDTAQNEKYFFKFQGEGLRYEVNEFATMINSSEKKGFKLTAGESTAIAEIMEKFLENRKL